MRVPGIAMLPYLVITFGLSWGLLALYIFLPEPITEMFGAISASHPAFIIAVYSPAFAAAAVVFFCGGIQGMKAYLSRLLLWRSSTGWYAFLILGIPLIYIAGSMAKGNLFDNPFPFDSIAQMLAAMAFMLVLGPIEEFGWRGVALPLLQRQFKPIWAALILGVIWGIWHLPAFFLSGTPQSTWGLMPFLIGSICLSVILTPLFNASQGSILLAAVYHFQIINPLWPDAQPHDTWFFLAAAVIVVWINRSTMFSNTGAVTEVIPGETKTSRKMKC
jgi:hypothetical protein